LGRTRAIRRRERAEEAPCGQFRRPGLLLGPALATVSRALDNADGSRPAVLAGPHEGVRSALGAGHQVQRPLAFLAGTFVEVRGTLCVLAQDRGDRVRGARGVGVVALGVEGAVDLDLDRPASAVLSPEPGRSSLHESSASLLQALT